MNARNNALGFLNFAYGSNLDEGLMRSRCAGRARRVGPAVLHGYRIAFEGYAGGHGVFATIRKAPGARVEGLVYALDASGLASLDRCEGVPTLYTREPVRVTLADGAELDAETYLHCGGHYGRPSGYYLRGIVEGYVREGFDCGPLANAMLNASRLAGRPFAATR